MGVSTSKTRYWSFILYEDSTIPNWLEFLKNLCIPIVISPLHDKDLNSDNTKKKSHRHVIVCFDGPTTYKNVLESICEPLNATIPKKVLSLRGYYRYLCHLDNPEKAQYNIEELIELGDFKMELTDTEINNVIIDTCFTIDEKGITNYKDLCDYYINLGYYDNFKVVRSNAFFFKTYLHDKKCK